MIGKLFKKIHDNIWMLRSLPKTLYFNFRYLPFSQAVKLPILLYKPRFCCLSGKVRIDAGQVRFGMVRLGVNSANIYPNSGIMLDIRGDVVFKGVSVIGNASYLSVGRGQVTFGDSFMATAALRIVCYEAISFGDGVLVGWNTLFCDNDFHSVVDNNTGITNRHVGKITVGDRVWIANGCSVMKNSSIPSGVIVGCNSLVNKPLDVPECSLVAGSPAILKKQNVSWVF